MSINLRKEDKIFIIEINEKFATKDPIKAKEILNRLVFEKIEHGNYFQLKESEKDNKMESEAKDLLGVTKAITEGLEQHMKQLGGKKDD